MLYGRLPAVTAGAACSDRLEFRQASACDSRRDRRRGCRDGGEGREAWQSSLRLRGWQVAAVAYGGILGVHRIRPGAGRRVYHVRVRHRAVTARSRLAQDKHSLLTPSHGTVVVSPAISSASLAGTRDTDGGRARSFARAVADKGAAPPVIVGVSCNHLRPPVNSARNASSASCAR